MPLPGRACRLDSSPVAVDDPLDRGQPDPDARELVLAVEALKGLEKTRGVPHVETRAIVTHGKPDFPDRSSRVKRDLRLLGARGVLPGVREEVRQDHVGQLRVAAGREALLDGPENRSRGLVFLQVLQDALCQARQVDDVATQVSPRASGKRQDAVDQVAHPDRSHDDLVQVLAGIPLQRLPAVLQQGMAEPAEGAKRRAKIVRDRIRERLQLPVRRFQFRGSFHHATLQLDVQRADLFLGAPPLADVPHEPEKKPAPVSVETAEPYFHRENRPIAPALVPEKRESRVRLIFVHSACAAGRSKSSSTSVTRIVSSSSRVYPRLSHARRLTSTNRPSKSWTNIASAACSTRDRKRISLARRAFSAARRSLMS